MLVTLAGIVMLLRSVQKAKAWCPMLATLAGITMLVRFLQYSKAYSPMLVTLPFVGITLLWQPTISFFSAVCMRQFPSEW